MRQLAHSERQELQDFMVEVRPGEFQPLGQVIELYEIGPCPSFDPLAVSNAIVGHSRGPSLLERYEAYLDRHLFGYIERRPRVAIITLIAMAFAVAYLVGC